MTQPDPRAQHVDIPDHTLTFGNGDLWQCACGATGDNADPTGAASATHVETRLRALLPGMGPNQFAQLLRAGAVGDTARTAAIELLIAHDHWMWFGYLRRYVTGRWLDGRLALYLEWRQLVEVLAAWQSLRDQLHAIDPTHTLDATPIPGELEKWREARWTDLKRAGREIHGSSSEMAVLRVAVSMATYGHQVNLYDDLACMDNRNRGLVLTAISHLLTHGGTRAVRTARTWGEYHAFPRAGREESPDDLTLTAPLDASTRNARTGQDTE